MTMEENLRTKLQAQLSPVQLEIVNQSHLHAHHHSSPQTGESHFHVMIVSEQFEGQNRLARHRLVHDVLREELAGQIHALAIEAYSPSERSAA